MKNNEINQNFFIREGEKKDREDIIKLTENIPSVAQFSRGPLFFKKPFIDYLLADDLVSKVVIFESTSGRIAGFAAAIRNPLKFYLRLGLRHPLRVGLIMFFRKAKIFFANFIKKKNISINKVFSEPVWSKSTDKIARVVFIGVAGEFRERGLATELYLFLAKILKKKGCIKIEAHIDGNNPLSLKLHQKTGWKIKKMPEGDYKAALELNNL